MFHTTFTPITKIRITALDRLFSKYIRLRAAGVCERCGLPKEFKQLQASHFHGRRKRSVRYEPDNAAALCFSCHRYFTENPQAHTEFFLKRLGQERFDMLNIRAQWRGSKVDLVLTELDLKDRLSADIVRKHYDAPELK